MIYKTTFQFTYHVGSIAVTYYNNKDPSIKFIYTFPYIIVIFTNNFNKYMVQLKNRYSTFSGMVINITIHITTYMLEDTPDKINYDRFAYLVDMLGKAVDWLANPKLT